VVIMPFDGARLVRVDHRDAHRIRSTEFENYFVFPTAVPRSELPEWATREDALRSLDPIRELPVPSIESGVRDLELNGREFEVLVGTGALDSLESLRLCRSVPRPEHLARLTSLRRLEVFGSSDDESFVLPAASLSAVPGLESCELSFLRIDDEGAAALAENPALSRITDLDLGCNEIGDRGVLAIASSSVLNNLQRLTLSWNPFREVSPLAVAGNLPALKELKLVDIDGKAESNEALQRRFGDGLSYYRLGGG
jgi:Leucine-rich repeat (LRR) protein